MPTWLIILIIILIVILLYYIVTYNSLVTLRNRVKDQWSQIDVQLKRRADLIPNLVETVKGYAKHEKQTFEDVVKARNTFSKSTSKEDEISSSKELTQMVSKIMALAESYPELKSNENFLSLQSDLKDTEEKISKMREFYNDVVLKYNNKVEHIPSNIIAKISSFTKEKYFEISEDDKVKPTVKF